MKRARQRPNKPPPKLKIALPKLKKRLLSSKRPMSVRQSRNT